MIDNMHNLVNTSEQNYAKAYNTISECLDTGDYLNLCIELLKDFSVACYFDGEFQADKEITEIYTQLEKLNNKYMGV